MTLLIKYLVGGITILLITFGVYFILGRQEGSFDKFYKKHKDWYVYPIIKEKNEMDKSNDSH